MPMINTIVQDRQVSALRASLGPVILASLNDPAVVEVMVNADGSVWADRVGVGRQPTGQIQASDAETIIRLIADHIGETVGEHNPAVSGTLIQTGERFQGILPPVSEAPVFTIRKRPDVIFTLDDYIKSGILSHSHAQLLRQAVKDKNNILVAGGTGSGKTTLANALLVEPAFRDDRVIIIEDTRELQCAARDKIHLLTKRSSPEVTMTDLLRHTLRLRPDRIVIGEVRGGEALALLKAWNTGHPGGVATCHANSAQDALRRIEELVGEVTQNIPHRSIASAIHYVLYIERTPEGRRVRSVCRVLGYDRGSYRFEELGAEQSV